MKKTTTQFEVIVGTYEEFVLGYQFRLEEDGNKAELVQTFATHSHRASIRSIACRGKLVVSGGADETINIYDMVTRKECGMLMEHDGTITSLSFTPDCSHLISCSDDGAIKVFRQGSWQMEKDWQKAHKGSGVTCLSVHPSGKLALSVGKDHTLRTWNMVKGRPAYTTNLYSRCRQLELVVWSPSGQLFAIPMDSQLEISNMEKAGLLHTIKVASKVTSCVFLSDEVVALGEASGEISAHSTKTGQKLWSLTGDQRIRGLAYHGSYLVAATSSGSISIYSAEDICVQPQQLVSADTGCRITCLTIYDQKSVIKKEPQNRIMSNNETGCGEMKEENKKKKKHKSDVEDSKIEESKKEKKDKTDFEDSKVEKSKKKKKHKSNVEELKIENSSFESIKKSRMLSDFIVEPSKDSKKKDKVKQLENKRKRKSSFIEEEINSQKSNKHPKNINNSSFNVEKWVVESSKR